MSHDDTDAAKPEANEKSESFSSFYRRYAQSSIHTISVAILTALGLLTSVHWGFIVVGIVSYVSPPMYLYLTKNTAKMTYSGFSKRRNHGDNSRPDSENISSESNNAVILTDAAETDTADDWLKVESPTMTTLHDVVQSQQGPYAVGDNGKVLARKADGWEEALEKGPTGQANPLRSAGVSSDGRAIWFAGDSGVVGQYDVADERFVDYSAPNDETSTWEDIAIVGPSGSETIHLVNGSGIVLRGQNDGGEIDWGTGMKPGSGSSLTTVEFIDSNCGYLCDTSQMIYQTINGGKQYESIGVEKANTDFCDLTKISQNEIAVAGGDGTIFWYDGSVWTQQYVGEHAITAINRTGDTGLASSSDGMIYELAENDWEAIETPVEDTLYGIIAVGAGPDVAVGDNGTIIERKK